MSIADKAKEIVYGDRENTYGDPDKNLNVIAGMWSAYTGTELSAADVCNMMCMLKIARLKNAPGHDDSLVDLVGYALLQERIKQSDKDTNNGQSLEVTMKLLNSAASNGRN